MSLSEFIKEKSIEKKALYENLMQLNRKHKSGRNVLKILSRWIDEAIKEFFNKFYGNIENVSIIALGGYGRSQLNPYSDIDVMILYTKLSQEIENLSKDLADFLYGLGYDASVLARTLKDCVKLSNQDDTVKTSLLDSKFVCGDANFYSKYERILKRIIEIDRIDYVKTKIEAFYMRCEKYGNTVFVLEPNIKEGVGGLRDYHCVVWIYKAIFGTVNALDIKKKNLMSDYDYNELTSALYFLWRLRNAMHFVAQSKNDILYLDSREAIAKELLFYPSAYFSAQERLMRKYYYYARKMHDVCEKLVKKASTIFNSNTNTAAYVLAGASNFQNVKVSVVEIDDKIKLVNGYIEYSGAFNLKNILLLFYYSIRYGAELSFDLLHLITTQKFFLSRVEAFDLKLFRLIFSYSKPIHKQVYQMHKSKLLNKLIPEFGKIYCLSEYSMYHKYTVDEHSLQTLSFLDELFDKKSDSQFIMRLQHILKSLDERDLFLIRFAALLHDIGKLKKNKHEIVGAFLSNAIANRFQLGFSLKEDLHFLVANHLLLNRVISYLDIDDAKTIAHVLNTVKNKRMLNLLVLLTYADMNAVNDNVWTKWKEQLMESLYLKSILAIEKKGQNEFVIMDVRKKKKNLAKHLDNDVKKEFLNNLPSNMLYDMDEQTIFQLVERFWSKQGNTATVFIENKNDYVRLFVFAKDKIGLINKIAGIMLCMDANIIIGKTYKLDNNYTIIVLTTNKKDLDEELVEKLFFKTEVDESFLDKCAQKNANKFLNRLEKTKLEMSIRRIDVEVNNNLSDIFTVVRIHAPDKLGLLYQITKVFKDLEIFIGSIIIDTKGEIAVDTFYVLSPTFNKVYEAKFIDLIKARMYEILS